MKMNVIAIAYLKKNFRRAIMGYVKAEDVLPEEVLELIRQYIDGELIYIPRKGEKRETGRRIVEDIWMRLLCG